jgi:hypothetical protein
MINRMQCLSSYHWSGSQETKRRGGGRGAGDIFHPGI